MSNVFQSPTKLLFNETGGLQSNYQPNSRENTTLNKHNFEDK